MEKPIDYSEDEKIIAEAIVDARKVQDFIWQELSLNNQPYNPENWKIAFQKRVDKIGNLKLGSPSMRSELRKRLLQQAALSILAIKKLDEEKGIF